MEEDDLAPQLFKELQAHFFQKVPLKEIFSEKTDWLETLTTSDQEKLLKMTVSSDACLNYPVAKEYQRKFLKGWIRKLEDTDAEISDKLYESYGELVSSSQAVGEELSYKTFMMSNDQTLVLGESTVMLSHGTTGLQIWPAAYWLAEWMLQHTDIFRNKSVLELGCGVGFTGLVACMTGRIDQYVFTDWHHRVLQSLHWNLMLNLRHTSSTKASLCEQCSERFEESEGHGTFCEKIRAKRPTSHWGESSQGLSKEGNSNKIDQNSTQLTGQDNKQDLDENELKCYDQNVLAEPETNSSSALLRGIPQSISSTNSCAKGYVPLSPGNTDHACQNDISSAGYESREDSTIEEGTGARKGPVDDGNDRGSTVVHLASLDWEQESNGGDEEHMYHPDIILAADVVFEPKLIRPLIRTLKRFLGKSKTSVALIASSVRNPETYNEFLKEIDAAGIRSEELAGPTSHLFYYDRSCPMKLLKLACS